ncbi:MAG: type II secretion system ATPase GspE [Deltaproteobacteria bacterium]|nr:type II secretion system ATPase GspE [Deltaproteobacteria bacterium]
MTEPADSNRAAEDPGAFSPEVGLLAKIPIGYARRHLVLPCRAPGGEVVLLAGKPDSREAVDEMRFLTGAVRVVSAPGDRVLPMIDAAYERVHAPERDIEDGLSGEWDVDVNAAIEETRDLLESPDEAPVIRFVHSVLFRAIRERSSDIHFEPYEKELVVRNRVDGILYPMVTAPRKWHAPAVSRVKVMAGLDIAERRLPQDGRIRIRLGGREIDIRVSTVPTAFGERAVLRILDRSTFLVGLSDLGLDPADHSALERVLSRSSGILLVTGPTGSGKTTTLYAALRRLDSGTKNIITIEDPVEYQIQGIGQIQVNPKIQLTFANGLRSILRQDPDIIMVGEIRDPETAEIAIQASLTGHLVLSTLHTNDSASAVTRLVDMGIEPFLVASSLSAVVAQRLVRRLCPECKVPYRPDAAEIASLGLSSAPSGPWYRPAGCGKCLQTGYAGRTGLFEILPADESIRSLILTRSDSDGIKSHAVSRGMRTVLAAGAEKVAAGLTSVEEVLRVTQEE